MIRFFNTLFKSLARESSRVLVVLLLLAAFSVAVYAFQEPSAGPPAGGSVVAPVNTGVTAQNKSGTLTIGSVSPNLVTINALTGGVTAGGTVIGNTVNALTSLSLAGTPNITRVVSQITGPLGAVTTNGANVTFSGAGVTQSGNTFTFSGGGGSGTVTNVATNNGLTGGPITTTGTIGLNTTGGLLTCTNATTNKLYWNGSALACGTDAGAGGGVPGGSNGAVQFNNSGTFGGDASNLFWDNNNKRLGIAKPNPAWPLQIGLANGLSYITAFDGFTYGWGILDSSNRMRSSFGYNASTRVAQVLSYDGEGIYIHELNSGGLIIQGNGNATFDGKVFAAGDIQSGSQLIGVSAFFNTRVDATTYYAGGSCVAGCPSDGQLKKNIESLSGSLEKVTALNPVSFEFNDPKYGAGPQEGLIAQEVEKIFPNWVTMGEDGYKRIRYGLDLQMQLIGAVKEQQKEIDLLKARIEALEAR